MEPRVSLITLGVSDLKKSVAFYENVVGWKPAQVMDEVAFFDLGGFILSLFPHAELAKDIGVPAAKPAAYEGFTVAYNARSIEEVDAIFAKLKKNGATIVKPPQKVFWGGYSGYFADVDGHKWEVAHNPFWKIMEDGRVSMK
jgi:uncharacterized glyoxalase superfamily protein PhnB